MHRRPLLTLLRQHTPADANEAAMTAQTIAFVEANPDCFERSLAQGHVTSSAWITSPDGLRVVLIHHRKLDRWFQPGGHADGDPDVAAVALREAQEETGLPDLKLVNAAVFDVDVHHIPARGDVAAHLHYDIRFRLKSDEKIIVGENSEVKEIRWLNLDESEVLAESESVGRMIRKTRQLSR
ncbi:NUDIX hydrolase [Fibrella aquatilis]|uniref:NUDIX hydrolase n=1 Tax=Fibrella aquatilis TaxID=2817059 RepID=A0A939JXQ9_9BACT|nr:NUDIX hydrolase [Fibrella aquatilis]MBO0931284.1 NUDIX hydrolase [Fibrella aquatilis]